MNATDIVTLTAETNATANRAVWSFRGHTVTISRRRLSSGNVRIRIEIQRPHVASAQMGHMWQDFRDLPADEANDLFVEQLRKWNGFYLESLPAWAVVA